MLYPARRSPFIGLGLYGAPVFIMLVSLAAPLSLSYLPWRGLRFALVLCRYKIDATPLEKRGKGLEFRWEAPALRFAPSRCPKPSPLCGCVCVHQNIIPDDMSIPSSASLAYRGGAMRGSVLYTGLGHALLSLLLAWPRLSYPTSSVAVRFTPLKRCSGASVVRP